MGEWVRGLGDGDPVGIEGGFEDGERGDRGVIEADEEGEMEGVRDHRGGVEDGSGGGEWGREEGSRGEVSGAEGGAIDEDGEEDVAFIGVDLVDEMEEGLGVIGDGIDAIAEEEGIEGRREEEGEIESGGEVRGGESFGGEEAIGLERVEEMDLVVGGEERPIFFLGRGGAIEGEWREGGEERFFWFEEGEGDGRGEGGGVEGDGGVGGEMDDGVIGVEAIFVGEEAKIFRAVWGGDGWGGEGNLLVARDLEIFVEGEEEGLYGGGEEVGVKFLEGPRGAFGAGEEEWGVRRERIGDGAWVIDASGEAEGGAAGEEGGWGVGEDGFGEMGEGFGDAKSGGGRVGGVWGGGRGGREKEEEGGGGEERGGGGGERGGEAIVEVEA